MAAMAWFAGGLLAAADASAQVPGTATPPAAAAPAVSAWWRDLRSISVGDVISAGAIVVVAGVLLWLANLLHNRLVALLSGRVHRGTQAEQENRARTLVGVLHNALRTVVIAAAVIMVLEKFHIPVAPLLGGVAVVGLAVAFGAQSLIKDYFTGFLILLEQQYMIGDVIKVGAISGQVERITLRLTVLRDLDGSVHFIPHGQINLVSNQTHGWSQAVFDLQVHVREPVESVREIFFSLADELRSDPKYGPMIVADAQMLGIESLGETVYSVKFVMRTLPLKRWEVRREMLRRIKERFQKLQIKVLVPA